ncbi:TIGR04222 domain-containing membrane protein [Erythrobacter sp. WG]|uniref:TIGR04222 domain-containing membrane protein n=1 Tax=Erythrobacter sp. WG TaxID=2985510 RepID=UPI00226E7DD2|nr:TIGR04222 domain-containing membrane protein [Erythrobacter sp. WG]MCX9146751.1 TIGR04222 domain-containing membrane protein [Erythrobacter sp. WG]
MQLFSSSTGSDFLFVYGVLLAASSVAAWLIPARWRDAGRHSEATDAESAAMLAGGRARLAETVMADLYVRGALEAWSGRRLVIAQRDVSVGPAGEALLAHEGPVTTSTAKRAVTVQAERLAARLRRAGLLMWPDDLLRLRWLSVAPLLAVLLFGLYRMRAAGAAGAPTGMLALLLAITAALAVIRFARSDPRTKAGIAMIEDLRARRGESVGCVRGDEVAMAVALYGTGVLVGTPWEALHALRHPANSGGADGSSGDGGSGCDLGDGDGCGE